MSEHKKNPDELGALWVRQGPKGAYMTGSVTINGEETRLVCFPNTSNHPKAPAWRVLRSKPKEARQPAPEDAHFTPDQSGDF